MSKSSASTPQIITGHAKIAGVAGWPISHSRSPRLHNYWLRRYGVDGVYVPFAIKPDDLETVLRALPLMGIAGMNLTLPHKQLALNIVDDIAPVAVEIGAVNTVWVDDNKRLCGTNTDAYGFWQALLQAYSDFEATKRPAVVIGAGGAARAIVVALQDAGVPEVRLTNRTGANAETLASTLSGRTKATQLICLPWSERETALQDAALIVNTTNLGMVGQPPLHLSLEHAAQDALVYDIVYVPLETPLLAEARQRGLAVLDGLGMLLHQARAGFSRWFGVEPEVDQALRAHILADLEA